ncbi:maker785, partial [Drosophila busckii]
LLISRLLSARLIARVFSWFCNLFTYAILYFLISSFTNSMKLKVSNLLICLVYYMLQNNVEVRSAHMKRIVNGLEAEPEQFPYQVYMEVWNTTTRKWNQLCGGTIISKKIVLTAAHCVGKRLRRLNPVTLRLSFGIIDISKKLEKGQQRMVLKKENIIINEKWSCIRNKINDIAILKLPEQLQFNQYIQPAKLPDPHINYDNKEAVASGWGTTGFNYNVPIKSPHLKFYRVTTMSVLFEPTKIAVINRLSTACHGDSGGPLAVSVENSVTVVGLASYNSAQHCPKNELSYFTRVSAYLDWIKAKAGAKNLE